MVTGEGVAKMVRVWMGGFGSHHLVVVVGEVP